MATITRENIGVLNEKIVVKVAKDDYFPSFQKAMKDYSRKANIPGFRKGMVPVGMVKKMYGSSVFADEVIKTVEKQLGDYMASEKLEIFAQPLPLAEIASPQLDMDQPSEYAFAFEVGLKPEFTVPDLGQANLTLYKVDVTEAMIDEQVRNLQLRSGQKSEEETIVSEDTVLYLTLVQCDAEGNELESGIRKNSSIPVSFFTPTFRQQLTDKKKDDEIVLELRSAFQEKELDGIIDELGLEKDNLSEAVFFKAVINKIERTEKAPVDDALFKIVYPGKEIATESDFRNEVKQEIQAGWDSQSRNQLLDQVYHELLDHTNIHFPEDFLKRWMLTGTEKQKTPEEVEQEFPSFVNQLKWTLITDKLVQENNIEVTPEDIREFARRQLLSYMGGYNMDGEQPWINDYIDKMASEKKFVNDNYYRIRTDKIFNWAETQLHPTEVTISADELIRMQKEHHH